MVWFRDGTIIASGSLPTLGETATSLDATLSTTGQYGIVVKTARGSGAYLVKLEKTAEGGGGSTSFGYTRRRMFLTTGDDPDAQLQLPLVDPFGNPLSGAEVGWERGTPCQPEGLCDAVQEGSTWSSLDGWAHRTVSPAVGQGFVYRPWLPAPPSVGAQAQDAPRAAGPAGDPRLGYLDMDLDAVRSGDLPSPAEAVEMERWQRFEIAQRRRSSGGGAGEARAMAPLDGAGCTGATLTCGDDTPVFAPVRLDLAEGETLADVTLTITDGTDPVTELDGHTVLTSVPLELQATATILEPGGGTHEIAIGDPVPVFVTEDTDASIEDPAAGVTCPVVPVTPGPFTYHVGKRAGMNFSHLDENGDPCCWAVTEEVQAAVVATVRVDDGQGGTIAVTRRVEVTVPSKPRPADACQVRAYPQDAPEIAGYGPWDSTLNSEQWQEVGSVYLVDACGNVLHGLGRNDSPDHNQPGDEFRITGVSPDSGGEVTATAWLDAFGWFYHLELHGTHDFGGNKVGIPEGVYQVNLEITSTADCGDGSHITDSFTADYANGRPVMELHWDIGRSAEPASLTASPEGALRDPATGAVAAWRVLPIDAGQVPETYSGTTHTDVPVRLYVARTTTFVDRTGTVVEDLAQVTGVELCTGEVHQLIDADHPWPGQVTVTCDQTHTDELTTTVSSDPADAWSWGGSYDGPLGLAVGITKAPTEPGDYYLVAEPLDEAFRRGQSWKVDHGIGWPRPVKRFTVRGGVILDGNMLPVDELSVDGSTTIYIRYVDGNAAGNEITVDLVTLDLDGIEFDKIPGVVLSRQGQSGVFMSQALDLEPAWYEPSGGGSMAYAMAGGTQQAKTTAGTGKVSVTKGGAFVASSVTRSGAAYDLLVGSKLEIALYRSFSLFDGTVRYWPCSPTVSPPDCGSDLVDPSQVDTLIDPAGADGFVARIEQEGASPDAHLFVRGIRSTDNPPGKQPNGIIKITLSPQEDSTVQLSAEIHVERPAHLGCCATSSCPGFGACTTTYAGNPVDLEALVIEKADEYGIPPQYLMAQMVMEAGVDTSGALNAYAYRYEPRYDFWHITGDYFTAAADNQRLFFHSGKALMNLGVDNGGTDAEYLPCEADPWGDLLPCFQDPLGNPPLWESGDMTLDPSDPSGKTWLITEFGQPTQVIHPLFLEVTVRKHDGTNWIDLTQRFPGDPAPSSNMEYTVNAADGVVTFGGSWPDTTDLVASIRRIRVNTQPVSGVAGFGASIPDPAALISTILAHNPAANNVPPAGVTMTIGEWARQRATAGLPNPVPANSLIRYQGKKFDNALLWQLMQVDPSFEIQGQWFAAASYGLFQVIPESVRMVLYGSGFSSSARSAILAVYDPRNDSPEKLFDPQVCAMFGALMDTKGKVHDEDLGPLVLRSDSNGNPTLWETNCVIHNDRFNECSWNRLWIRRLTVFNTGNETGGEQSYGNKVLAAAPNYSPIQ